MPSPTYKSVCAGDGHTEALKLVFDPAKISFEALITRFFEDPRVRSVHSSHEKAQYKTAVWAQDEAQAAAARRVAWAVGKDVPVLPRGDWHDAEEWHQHFLLGFKDIPDDEDDEGSSSE